jgi:hypothetical protein
MSTSPSLRSLDASDIFIGYEVWVAKSSNGGASFQPEFLIKTPDSDLDVPKRIYANGSNFYILFVAEIANDIYFHHGNANSMLTNATRVNPIAGRAYGLSGDIAVDANGTTIYAVFADATSDPEGDVVFCKSFDTGATWGSCVRVNDNTYRYQYYPSIARDASGTLHVVWTDFRSGSKEQTYYASSINGGISFSPNLNVSAAQSGAAFTQAHLSIYGPGSLLYVSSSRDVNQVVLARGSFATVLRRARGQITSQ